jgi:signal transduction histidine kinase
MKYFFMTLLVVLLFCYASSQKGYVDSLHSEIKVAGEDSSRIFALFALAEYYGFNQFDSSFFYAQRIIELSEKLKYDYGRCLGYRGLFYAYNCQGNYPKALEATIQNFKIAEKIRNERPLAFFVANYFLGILHREMGNLPIAINQFRQCINFVRKGGLPESTAFPAYVQLALVYEKLQKSDSALWYAQKGYDLGSTSKGTGQYLINRYVTLPASVLGEIHGELRHFQLARQYFQLGVYHAKRVNNSYYLARNYNNLANLFNVTGQPDSGIYYANLSLELCQQHKFGEFALVASSLLTKIYESQHKPDSTIKYMRIMLEAKDSVLGQSKVKEFQKAVFDDEQRQQDIEKQHQQYINKIKTYALLSGIVILLFIAFILWRNNRQKQRSKKKIEEAYEELKSTQAQLVQQEKMASLGELTAGIAHEIQNPLNFVNNFSEVNNELIDEMNNEDDINEIRTIADDIRQNNDKISFHGKRADAIVKGMLQHSRVNTGQKELTDINALCDEYLRLAYHGFKAKDKSFNTVPITIGVETDFDPSVGKINIVPQDIGRVIVNLINNAFYAVNERAKLQAAGYMPQVIVQTKRISGKDASDGAEIRVTDNGDGIPQKILGKIFQPFFTTKPTGQGTGLGLSLAYDIVKAHGGEIKVETKEGEGSAFIVLLPLAMNAK